MGNSPVDRDSEYMYKMWGTTNLITDYWSKPNKSQDPEERVIQEVYGDSAPINKVKKTIDQWQFHGSQEHLET
jgi:hypothetical protein